LVEEIVDLLVLLGEVFLVALLLLYVYLFVVVEFANPQIVGVLNCLLDLLMFLVGFSHLEIEELSEEFALLEGLRIIEELYIRVYLHFI
jgi:hypothetical protein